jgi:hypothetical protein
MDGSDTSDLLRDEDGLTVRPPIIRHRIFSCESRIDYINESTTPSLNTQRKKQNNTSIASTLAILTQLCLQRNISRKKNIRTENVQVTSAIAEICSFSCGIHPSHIVVALIFFFPCTAVLAQVQW